MNGSRLSRIQTELESRFAPARVSVRDDSASHAGHPGAQSGAGHFAVRIVSQAFSGRSPLQRHRMVYEALAEMMPSDIHALIIEAISPDDKEKPRTS
ncbi:MAG: BolA family protein [Steroidobacteraceae bacterium]